MTRPRHRAQSRRRSGFTLTELLIVIGIILVLLGLLMPAILAIRRNADRSRTKADLQAVETALNAYKEVFKDYPRQMRPDWPVTQTSRQGPERVLAKYLLGWDPDPDNSGWINDANEGRIDGKGVRSVKTPDGVGANSSIPGDVSSLNKGRKWGPYLSPDRFRVGEDVVGALTGSPTGTNNSGPPANNISQAGKLLDRYGNEILYYPKWNNINPTQVGSLVGPVTRVHAGTNPRAMFNLYDGIAFNPSDSKSVAHLDHLLYMLGDGPDLAPGNPPTRLPPQQGAPTPPTGYPNNQIQSTASEALTFTGDFILVSTGPDKVWGLSELYDVSNSNKAGANRKRSKVDDVYNFER